MNKLKIISDSTCDLTKEYLEQNEIDIIPLTVTFGEEEYADGVDMNVEQLYQKVDDTGIMPKTAAISVGKFIEVFGNYTKEGYDILFIGISSKFSSVYQNANIAKEEIKGNIYIHDSYNLSSGIGLQVAKAVDLRKEGKSPEEIMDVLKEISPKVRSQFMIETLDYLYKGGRCSGTSYFFGRGLKIKPIIRVVDGGMIVYKKPIGKTINSLNKLLEIFKLDLEQGIDLTRVMITHSQADESCKYLKEELGKIIDPSIIVETNAGCVISSHCGRGTIGILYILK